MRPYETIRLPLLAFSLIVAYPALAGSADVIEEIVVLGEFHKPLIDETSASVSVISLDEQRRTTVNHLEEVLGWAPNVNFASGASRGRFLQIRGIGERGQFDEPLNSSVGMSLDGVDMSGIGTVATTFDVSQVEIFRGPQGTIFGANALAGLVNVVSHDPTDEFEASMTLDAGNYDAIGVGAVISGPLNDAWSYRLAVRQYSDDGFIDNDYLGDDDTDDHDETTVRAKLSWRPSEVAEWRFTWGWVDVDNGYDAFSLDNDDTTYSDQPGRDNQESSYGNVRVSWDVNETVAFEGSVGFASSDIDYGYDEDWTFVGFHPFGYSSTDRYQRDRDTATIDLRWLASSPGVDWVVGVYGLTQDVELLRQNTFLPADFRSEFEIDRVAAFGEATLPVADNLRLRLGLRAERHTADYSDSVNQPFDFDDDLWGGRLVAEVDLEGGALLYAGATRGYKAGGFNTNDTLAPVGLRAFDPEALWNFEVGYKGAFADGRLTTRAALFYMHRDDVQISTYRLRQRPGGAPEVFVGFIDNAAEGYNLGLEVEATWAASERLELFANLGLLDTEYEDYINGAGDDFDGREQAHAPSYQFFVGAQLAITERWFARLEVEGKDEFFFSDSHGVESDAYELINATIGYLGSRWSAKLWARNLTDEETLVRGFFFPNDPRDGYIDEAFTQLGEPRRYGVTVSIEL